MRKYLFNRPYLFTDLNFIVTWRTWVLCWTAKSALNYIKLIFILKYVKTKVVVDISLFLKWKKTYFFSKWDANAYYFVKILKTTTQQKIWTKKFSSVKVACKNIQNFAHLSSSSKTLSPIFQFGSLINVLGVNLKCMRY